MWQRKQLERLHEVEPDIVDIIIMKLLEQESGLRDKLVIGAYLEGDINFGKAAELLHIHPVELRKQFLAQGIPVRIGVESKEEIVAEGMAAKEIRENLIESPCLAVFVNLGLPAVCHFREYTGAVYHQQAAIKALSHLFGRIAG